MVRAWSITMMLAVFPVGRLTDRVPARVLIGTGLGTVTLGLSFDLSGSCAPRLLGFIVAGVPLLVAAMFLKTAGAAVAQWVRWVV